MKKLVRMGGTILAAALLVICVGCSGIVINVTGPSSGMPGAQVQYDASFIYSTSSAPSGAHFVEQFSVDVPAGWTVASATWEMTDVSGSTGTVSGVATQATSPTLCTAATAPGPVPSGYQRIYLLITQASMPENSSFSGVLHVTLDPHSTPAGVYYPSFWSTGRDDSTTSVLCGDTGPTSGSLQKVKRYVIGSETDVNFTVAPVLNADVIVNNPGGTMDPTQSTVGETATDPYSYVTQSAATALAGTSPTGIAYGLPDDGRFNPAGGPHVTLGYRNSESASTNNARRSTAPDSFNFAVTPGFYYEVHLFGASGDPLTGSSPSTTSRLSSVASKATRLTSLISQRSHPVATTIPTRSDVPPFNEILDPTNDAKINVTLTYSSGSPDVISNVDVPLWSAFSIPHDIDLGSGPGPTPTVFTGDWFFGGNLGNPYAYPLAGFMDAADPAGTQLQNLQSTPPGIFSHFLWGLPIPVDHTRTLTNVKIDRVDTTGSVFTFFGATGVKIGGGSALGVVKSLPGGRSTVNVGENYTYRLVATNGTGGALTNAQIEDTLPAATTFVSVTSSAGSCVNNFNLVTCTVPTLAAGASVTVDVTVQAFADGPIMNTGQFTASPAPDTTVTNASNAVTVLALAPTVPTLSWYVLAGLALALGAVALTRFHG